MQIYVVHLARFFLTIAFKEKMISSRKFYYNCYKLQCSGMSLFIKKLQSYGFNQVIVFFKGFLTGLTLI